MGNIALKQKGMHLRIVLLLALCLSSGSLLAEPAYWVYKVRPGDNIWNLAERFTTSVLNWKRLQRLNNIPDGPDRRIKPGTRLRFPIDILKHQPASARIVRLAGEVRHLSVDGRSRPATATSELVSGDTLVTGENSNLTIRFADGSELLVLGGSTITMDSLSAYGDTGMVDTRLRLQSGQVDTRVRPSQGPGSRYQITTPAAVAAVRGTEFRFSAEKEETVSRSEVLEGSVKISATGETRLVRAGYGLVTRGGSKPEKPRPLLTAPDLGSMDDHLDRLPLQFTWNPLQGATGYRFQITRDDVFGSLLADGSTPTHRAFWPDLPDGDYVIQVRGVDEVGLEGLNARRTFTVDARPEPPVPTGLGGGVVVREPMPVFGWSIPQGIETYHLQITDSEAFANLLYDENGYEKERFVPPRELEPGTYFWRIASIDGSGEQGPFSDTLSFTYKPVPPTPEIEAPELSEDGLVFRWLSAGENMRYQVQFSSDDEFSELLVDRIVDEPRLEMGVQTPGRYYLQVRAIDETGFSGPYSTPQRVEVEGSYWSLVVMGIFLLLL